MPAEGGDGVREANGWAHADCTLWVEYRKPVYAVNCIKGYRISTECSESLPIGQVSPIMNSYLQSKAHK